MHVQSTKLLFKFAVDQLEIGAANNYLISAFNSTLVLSYVASKILLLYSWQGQNLTEISLESELRDVTWTLTGNIVCAVESHHIVRMSLFGKISFRFKIAGILNRFSLSNDGNIYITVRELGVYQSTNDGITWTLLFQSANQWYCIESVKLTTKLSENFWITQYNKTKKDSLYDSYIGKQARLRVYSLSRSSFDSYFKWRDIQLPEKHCAHVDFSRSKMSQDNFMNIFIGDQNNNAIHVVSVNGQYRCEVVTSFDINANSLLGLTVERDRRLLYVGLSNGVILVYNLTYANEVTHSFLY